MSARTHFITDRPVAVIMVFLAALVFGIFSFTSLPITLMPELSYPTITVRTEYAGAAPEEVENEISRPVEEALGVITGLNRISSISRSGASDVVLEFTWGTNISDATQDTLEKLDLVRLPEEAGRPLILHFDPSLDPVMELSFSGEGQDFTGEEGQRKLRRIAELQIKRALEPIKGVAAVRIRGGLEEQIHVDVDATQLLRSKLTVQDVINRLQQENINVAGGTVKEGRAEYMIRTLNEFEDLDQMRETILAYIEGKPLRLKDIATIKRSHKEVEIMTHTDGVSSVQVDIFKEADANMVALSKRIETALGPYTWLEKEEKNQAKVEQAQNKDENVGPSGGKKNFKGLSDQLYQLETAKLQIVADRSTFIENSINEVKNTAVIGGALAILILFLFLQNGKSTVIIAVSIPMSILITFAPLHLAGVSLNIMSLGGLALGIGMLVDSSIVVLESIFRCREEGDSIREAAIRGTKEVRSAVIASTLTSIAVFFPMVFVEGIAGQAFGDLGMAVVISLIASLLVAIFFIPMLASRGGMVINAGTTRGPIFHSWATFKASMKMATWVHWITVVWFPFVLLRTVFLLIVDILLLVLRFIGLFMIQVAKTIPIFKKIFDAIAYIPLKMTQGFLKLTQVSYEKLLRWSLKNTISIVLIVIACFAVIVQIGKQLGNELLPEVHQGEFTFQVQMPVGTPVEETYRALNAVEDRILLEKDGIENLIVTYGYDVTQSQSSDEGEHTGKFKVILEPNRNQAKTEERIMARVREYFNEIPDVLVSVKRPVLFSEKTPIEVEIHSDNLELLRSKSQEVKSLIAQLPECTDVETSLRDGAPEIQVIYDRNKMLQYGLNIGDVATKVRDLVKGFEATQFNLVDRRIPIVVRLEEEDRKSQDHVSQIIVNPNGEHPLPLYAIASLEVGEGPSEVRRIDGKRVALVNANIGQGSLGNAVAAIEEVLTNQVHWPDDMTFFLAGQNEEWEKSRGSLLLALALSIFLVYVIMAAQFESLIHPFIIMFSIPLAFVGTVLGLYLMNISLSVVVFLGMIMLAGIVVNNAIVFVDYINTLRGKGMELFESVLTAGQVRLRPILMTTATTILGLLPMAVGVGDGAEIRTPMALAVIFGLFTSTFLTLIIIPSLYLLFENWKAKLFKTALVENRGEA